MLCIFDMAQTAADPLYPTPPAPPPSLPTAFAPACEAHNGKTIFVLKITKLMASFRLAPRPRLYEQHYVPPRTHTHSSRVRVCHMKQANRLRYVGEGGAD